MLKIKDNVDLKEFEKFGYLYYDLYKCYYKPISESDCDLVIDKNRIIYHSNYSTADMNACAKELAVEIFDLIQAGLVEKVVEDEK